MKHVLALPLDLRVAALGAALAVCAAEEAPAIVAALIADVRGGRRRLSASLGRWLGGDGRVPPEDAAMAALVGCWERVPRDLRFAAAAVGAGRWSRIVEMVATDADPARRIGVPHLAADVSEPIVAECAAALLADPDEAVASAAEAALVSMAVRAAVAVGDMPREMLDEAGPVWSAGAADRLAAIVAHAAGAIEEHRRRGAVVAAMVLCGRGRGEGVRSLRSWRESRAGGESGPLHAALRWARLPMARLRALEWVHVTGFETVASERLARAAGVAEHEIVLASWHRGLRPARRDRLRAIKVSCKAGREAGLPNAAAMGMLTESARRGAVAMAGLMRPDAASRREVMGAALGDESAQVRHAAARAASFAALPDWCFDRDARVARSAFLRWSAVGAGGGGACVELCEHLRRSADPMIRAWAAEEGGLVRRVSAVASEERAERIRAAMLSGDEVVALRALAEVRSAGRTQRFASEVLELAAGGRGGGAGAKVVATAMAMTGAIEGAGREAARAAQVRGLKHADRRVRANAVEAIASVRGEPGRPPVVHALMELKGDPDHRVRANVLRAALREPGLAARGASEVLAMLNDERAMHRLAAVWLAGRSARLMNEVEIGERVRALAEADPLEHVRARAGAVVRRLGSGCASGLGVVGRIGGAIDERVKEVA